ncbi:MAG: hypothetical protein KME21_31375 [Desmonostoc vinosum HA7617-LM4]|jgi:hypothetical protein|nr:hypothetical protein [Desmonostoc vinosum HA7617-LM4]
MRFAPDSGLKFSTKVFHTIVLRLWDMPAECEQMLLVCDRITRLRIRQVKEVEIKGLGERKVERAFFEALKALTELRVRP